MNVGATVSILKSTQILGHLFLHTATILHQNSALSPLDKNKQKIKCIFRITIFQNYYRRWGSCGIDNWCWYSSGINSINFNTNIINSRSNGISNNIIAIRREKKFSLMHKVVTRCHIHHPKFCLLILNQLKTFKGH